MLLAQSFTQRIIGLRGGVVVFDGAPDRLDDAALTSIYGEEDWTAMRRGDGYDAAPDDAAGIQGDEKMASLV